jgi:hypothetical protein
LTGIIPESFWQGPFYPNLTTNYTLQQSLKTNCGSGCLFNLLNDPTEHNNVASSHPSVSFPFFFIFNYINKKKSERERMK